MTTENNRQECEHWYGVGEKYLQYSTFKLNQYASETRTNFQKPTRL